MLRRTASGWVHYKLDQGVDHILVDEAQDTSPRQWEIVSHIAEDFATGAGARGGVTRTIFAVGDEKQSIFSFQGAAPHEFDRWHRQFRSAFRARRTAWDKDIRLSFSFRSGLTILKAVDAVFKDEAIYRSIHTAANGRRSMKRWPTRRPASSISGIWRCPTKSRTSKAGPRRSTRFRKPARKPSSPRASNAIKD